MKKTLFYLLWLLPAFGCVNNSPAPPPTVLPELVSSSTPSYFIHISDVHLDASSSSTQYGEDTGMDLWKITYNKLDSLLGSPAPPQFVLFTGDLPKHNTTSGTTTSQCNPQQTEGEQDSDHLQNITTLINSLYTMFQKHQDIPFFYLPGNNDGLRCDYCSFDDDKEGTWMDLFPQDSLPAMNAAGNCGKSPCVLDHHLSKGYYSAKIMSGLRLIALNSIIFGGKYIVRDKICQEDAGNEQMDWLREQLADAAKKNDKVYLAMHIPPGIDAHKYGKDPSQKKAQMWANLPAGNPWINQFLAVVDSNQQTIAGILYGHTHMDEVRRLYNPAGTQVTEAAVSAPGISLIHSNNPGFKLVYFDSKSKELTDFVTCYTTPGVSTYGDSTYRFSSVFGGAAGLTLYDRLKNMPLQTLDSAMNTIYLVKSPAAHVSQKNTIGGIEVKALQ